MTTNRDIYVFICDLIERNKNSSRSLEEYLRSLRNLFTHYADKDGLSPEEFTDALEAAYEAQKAVDVESMAEGFAPVFAYLEAQISDLEQLTRDGVYQNDQAYFGVSAESGRRWYNFHISSYLECGMAGSLGGWEPDDDSGRAFVPGDVMTMDEDGTTKVVAPQDIERPTYAVPRISWEEIEDFLWSGANYE